MELQLTRAAERGERECHKNEPDDNGKSDEPAGRVAAPRTNCGIEPCERENRKGRSDEFMKKLFQNAPEPAKAARFNRMTRAAPSYNCRHRSSLAQFSRKKWSSGARPRGQGVVL